MFGLRIPGRDSYIPVPWESVGCVGVYCWPRHHIGVSGAVSFLGSGSQKYCTIRLHFSRSTPVISAALFVTSERAWGLARGKVEGRRF